MGCVLYCPVGGGVGKNMAKVENSGGVKLLCLSNAYEMWNVFCSRCGGGGDTVQYYCSLFYTHVTRSTYSLVYSTVESSSTSFCVSILFVVTTASLRFGKISIVFEDLSRYSVFFQPKWIPKCNPLYYLCDPKWYKTDDDKSWDRCWAL